MDSKWLAVRAFPRLMYNRKVRSERASYNGSIEASQASDVGSIPIARSITHDDPTGLPRLALRLQCRSWHPSYDPVWLDRAPVAGFMRDESELCNVKEVSFRPSAVDTGKSCIPREIPSDLKFFFRYAMVVPPTPGILYEGKNR